MGTDSACVINGEEIPSIFDLMVHIDKEYISSAEGYQFHGDDDDWYWCATGPV